LPLSIEIAIKSGLYMGEKGGRWKEGYDFSRKRNDSASNPGSVIRYVTDLSIKYMPTVVRNEFWDAGIVYALASNMEEYFIPALKTVYVDMTSIGESVNNNFFTAVAIGYLNKITYDAWSEFSGVDDLTDKELIIKVNEYVNNRTKDIFDGKFVVIPKTLVSEGDKQRGYSWLLPIDIYSNNMKTVMSTYVTSKNMKMLGMDTESEQATTY